MEKHDVVIIGSGMTGGTVARSLTRKGISVLMLEAGPPVDFDRHRGQKRAIELPYRGFGQPGRFPHITQANEYTASLWADEKENPYSYDPRNPYYWVRVRKMGGRTLLWGRQSLRMSDFEFKGHDHDGYGDNWPISYTDLKSYYDEAERLLRVSGRRENLPQLPDCENLQITEPSSLVVSRFEEACSKMGITTTRERRAQGELASSVNLLLPDAAATGKLKIVPDAVVSRVTTDSATGLANGVEFVDRRSKRNYEVQARVVVVGASTLESTRILLNSATRQYPNGLANSSGVLGRYLFDHFYVKGTIQAMVPELRGKTITSGMTGGGGLVVRFRNLKERDKRFLRGYAMGFGAGGTPDPNVFPLYGSALEDAMREHRGTSFGMTTMGEVLPRRENFVEIDKTKTDAWGIPVLRIHHVYSDNERAMAKDAMEMGEQMCRNAGFEVLAKHDQPVPPGESIHELGTCRMGADPKTSVLNSFQQAHDVKNLFVVDGSSFVSAGSQNPTLSMVALALRSSEYLAEEMRKGNL